VLVGIAGLLYGQRAKWGGSFIERAC